MRVAVPLELCSWVTPPVWSGAAGSSCCVRPRPRGHAVRVWANSGVNIDGSNWRTTQRGISYIPDPCGSAENVLSVDFWSWKRAVRCMPKTFFLPMRNLLKPPPTLLIQSLHTLNRSRFNWSNKLQTHQSVKSFFDLRRRVSFNAGVVHLETDRDKEVVCCWNTKLLLSITFSNLVELQWSY